MKVQWKDKRKSRKYFTNRIFADLPCTAIPEDDPYIPTFTIAPEHHDGLYSMEKLYMEHYSDPTEYSFVQDVFEGDLDHWEAVKNSQWLAKYCALWRKNAEAKLLSDAMMKIVSTQDTYDYFNDKYNACEIRYGDMKKQLAEDIISFTSPIRERILEVAADEAYLNKVIMQGAEQARESAVKTLIEARKLIGFNR